MRRMSSLRKYIDIGANLTDDMYQGVYHGSKKHEPDLNKVMDRAWDVGMDKMIITGGSLVDSKKAINVARTDCESSLYYRRRDALQGCTAQAVESANAASSKVGGPIETSKGINLSFDDKAETFGGSRALASTSNWSTRADSAGSLDVIQEHPLHVLYFAWQGAGKRGESRAEHKPKPWRKEAVQQGNSHSSFSFTGAGRGMANSEFLQPRTANPSTSAYMQKLSWKTEKRHRVATRGCLNESVACENEAKRQILDMSCPKGPFYQDEHTMEKPLPDGYLMRKTYTLKNMKQQRKALRKAKAEAFAAAAMGPLPIQGHDLGFQIASAGKEIAARSEVIHSPASKPLIREMVTKTVQSLRTNTDRVAMEGTDSHCNHEASQQETKEDCVPGRNRPRFSGASMGLLPIQGHDLGFQIASAGKEIAARSEVTHSPASKPLIRDMVTITIQSPKTNTDRVAMEGTESHCNHKASQQETKEDCVPGRNRPRFSGASRRRYAFWLKHGLPKAEAVSRCSRPLEDFPEYQELMAADMEEKKQAAKRPRSNQGSPQEQPKKARVEGPAYAEVAGSVKIGITDRNRPITAKHASLIEQAIHRLVLRGTEGAPHFQGSTAQAGTLILTCRDRETRNWVATHLADLAPWEGSDLKLVDESELPNSVLVVAYFPKMKADGKTVLRLLHEYNEGVGCDRWRVVSVRPEGDGQTYCFSLDSMLLPDLQRRDCTLDFGFKPVRFRVKGPKNGPATGGDGGAAGAQIR